MTGGTIDLKVVGDRLGLVTHLLAELRAIPTVSLEEFVADRRNPAAAESLLRRSLEALLDTARHLLAKAFARGALEYREVARLARRHALIEDPELAARFEKMAGFRTLLTHHYAEVTDAELFGILHGHLGDLAAIRDELERSAARLATARS